MNPIVLCGPPFSALAVACGGLALLTAIVTLVNLKHRRGAVLLALAVALAAFGMAAGEGGLQLGRTRARSAAAAAPLKARALIMHRGYEEAWACMTVSTYSVAPGVIVALFAGAALLAVRARARRDRAAQPPDVSRVA
jgi:hypothetical protein